MNPILLLFGICFFGVGVAAVVAPREFGGVRSFASAKEWKKNPEMAEEQHKAISYLIGLACFSAAFLCLVAAVAD